MLVDSIGDLREFSPNFGERRGLTHCDADVYNGITTNQTIGGAIRVGISGLIDKVKDALDKERLREEESTVGKPGKNTCEEIPFVMSQEGPEQRVLARFSG